MSETIEEIILQQDKRGMSALRPHLPADFCSQAAGYIMDHPGGAIIVSGYYALMSHKPETDGPPGAMAIGNALRALGRRVTYVTDLHTAPVLRDWLGPEAEVEEFPIAHVPTSQRIASETLDRLKPGLLISIERSSRTKDDTYLNMRDIDISPYTARVDYLFEAGIPSVGIGDGGNEIGMGNLVEIIPTVDSLPNSPAVTKVDRLVITSVSNWGGYGLVAALSLLAGKNLLPSVDHEARLIRRMVEIGVVDGTTGEAIPTVDNFSLEVNGEVLEQLHRVVAEGIGG
jgi:hypothetical protein